MFKTTKITKEDEKILAHLIPVGEYADTYFCFIYYKNKGEFMYSVFDKVKKWVEKNGGRCDRVSNKKIIGERKGFECKIVFPTFAVRNMKEIMATLYERSSK